MLMDRLVALLGLVAAVVDLARAVAELGLAVLIRARKKEDSR